MKKRNPGPGVRGRLLALLASAVIVGSASAGEALGTIEFVQAGHGYTPDNVYVLVLITGSRSGAPGCATDPRLAINPNTAAGKAIMAVLMTAKAAGNTVHIYGKGSCDVMGTEFESIDRIRLL